MDKPGPVNQWQMDRGAPWTRWQFIINYVWGKGEKDYQEFWFTNSHSVCNKSSEPRMKTGPSVPTRWVSRLFAFSHPQSNRVSRLLRFLFSDAHETKQAKEMSCWKLPAVIIWIIWRSVWKHLSLSKEPPDADSEGSVLLTSTHHQDLESAQNFSKATRNNWGVQNVFFLYCKKKNTEPLRTSSISNQKHL